MRLKVVGVAMAAVVTMALGSLVAGQEAPAGPTKPATLTEAQQSRVEIQLLKEQLFQAQVEGAQCRAMLADRENRLAGTALGQQQVALVADREKLERELVAALGGQYDKGDRLNWDQKPPTLKKAEPAERTSAAAAKKQ